MKSWTVFKDTNVARCNKCDRTDYVANFKRDGCISDSCRDKTEEEVEYLWFLDILDRSIDHAGSDKIVSPAEYKFAKGLILHSLRREKARNGYT